MYIDRIKLDTERKLPYGEIPRCMKNSDSQERRVTSKTEEKGVKQR